jgi:expansin (peptidoglycan-binding protein)
MKLFSKSSLLGGLALICLGGIAGDIYEMKDISTRDTLSSLLAIGGYVAAIAGAYFVQKGPDGKRLKMFLLFLALVIVLAFGSLFV